MVCNESCCLAFLSLGDDVRVMVQVPPLVSVELSSSVASGLNLITDEYNVMFLCKVSKTVVKVSGGLSVSSLCHYGFHKNSGDSVVSFE